MKTLTYIAFIVLIISIQSCLSILPLSSARGSKVIDDRVVVYQLFEQGNWFVGGVYVSEGDTDIYQLQHSGIDLIGLNTKYLVVGKEKKNKTIYTIYSYDVNAPNRWKWKSEFRCDSPEFMNASDTLAIEMKRLQDFVGN
jgi:hypothetical protein